MILNVAIRINVDIEDRLIFSKLLEDPRLPDGMYPYWLSFKK